MKSALFTERAKAYFPEEQEAFFKALEEPARDGFFLNTQKGSEEELLKFCDFPYEPYPRNPHAWYHHCEKIGRHPTFELGLLYGQEPSASLPAELPDLSGVRFAADLCAAPGGKSCGLLRRLPQGSFLLANDISYKRAEILSSNIERMGFGNALVTSLAPKEIARRLPESADLVILDAPCSGEGMIRKDDRILQEYSLANIEACARRQQEIFEAAYALCAPGGQILYSTCTFAPEEDEENVSFFLEKYPDLCSETLPNGKKSWKLSFQHGSEGQFMALFRKEGTPYKQLPLRKEDKCPEAERFLKEESDLQDFHLYRNKERIFLSRTPLPEISLPCLRSGIYAGDLQKGNFLPAHCLYRANDLQGHFRKSYEVSKEEYEQILKGLEIPFTGPQGYVSLTYGGFPLGYGKSVQGRLKNKYPKGLRRMV